MNANKWMSAFTGLVGIGVGVAHRRNVFKACLLAMGGMDVSVYVAQNHADQLEMVVKEFKVEQDALKTERESLRRERSKVAKEREMLKSRKKGMYMVSVFSFLYLICLRL